MARMTARSDRRLAAVLLTLLACRLTLAVLVVPPWQHPDEPQHVEDIASLVTARQFSPLASIDPAISAEVVRSMADHHWWEYYHRSQPSPLPSSVADVVEGNSLRHPRAYYVAASASARLLGIESLMTSVLGASSAFRLSRARNRGSDLGWHASRLRLVHRAWNPGAPRAAPAVRRRLHGREPGGPGEPGRGHRVVAGGQGDCGSDSLGESRHRGGGRRRWRPQQEGRLPAVADGGRRLCGIVPGRETYPARRPGPRAWLVAAPLILAVALGVLLLPEWVRVYRYGADIFKIPAVEAARASPDFFRDFSRNLFQSAWLNAGWLTLPATWPWYSVAIGLTSLGLLSVVRIFVPGVDRQTRLMIAVALAFVGIQVAAIYATYYVTGYPAQGRYLFPAIGPALALIWVGGVEWAPAPWHRLPALLLLGVAFWLDARAWADVIIPGFAR